MKNMRTLMILVLVMLSLSACRAGPPWQKWMFEGPPPGRPYTPLYVEGWKAGCHTGVSASGSQWYKQFYKFKQDPILAQNRVYYKGWKDAYDYCQRYIYNYHRRTFF